MKRKFKAAVLAFVLMLAGAIVGEQTASAECIGVSCAAVCRYICEFQVTGNCTDQQINNLVQQCCAGAFANTPGINDVPCLSGGAS